MASSQIVTYHSGIAYADNSTIYISLSGGLNSSFIIEDRAETPIREAGNFRNLFVYVPTNTATVTSVITLRKSRAATSLTVSYTSTQTGIKEDTTNSVSFISSDEGDWQIVVPDTVAATSITITMLGTEFVPANNSCVTFFITTFTAIYTAASTTDYFTPIGTVNTFSATENNAKYRSRFVFTSSNFYTYLAANARTTDTVYGTRKNGGNGNQSVTYTSTQTGAKEDTTNTDSIAIGDDYNYYRTTGTGTDSATVNQISTKGLNTSRVFATLAGQASGVGVGPTVTDYNGLSGRLAITTTEANSQIYSRFTFTASELGAYVITNTNAASSCDVFIRDNGADSPITVSYAAAQTGLKNDSANTTMITSVTDEISYKIINNDAAGTITFAWVGVLGQTNFDTSNLPFMGVG